MILKYKDKRLISPVLIFLPFKIILISVSETTIKLKIR